MSVETASPALAQCFLCASSADPVVWREHGIEGRQCSCGMLYADGVHAKVSFPDLTQEFHAESFYSLPARLKATWMASSCHRGTLLDVGCGEGYFLAEAKALGFSIAGMEPDTARAQAAMVRLCAPMEKAFIEDDTLPASSFDVVYHCDLLAHFPDPLRALESMKRLLRPGGVLCFEVGILGGIPRFWYSLIGELGLGQHRHLYSRQALRNLLDRAGLQTLHRKDYGLAPAVIIHPVADILTRRLLRPLFSLLGGEKGARRARALQDYVEYFFRYRVGAITPRSGPATVLIVAAPRRE